MSQSRDVAVDHDGLVTSTRMLSLSLSQFPLSESLGSLGDDPSSRTSAEGRMSGDGVEIVEAADGVASGPELPTAGISSTVEGDTDSAANKSPWGRFLFVQRAEQGFPELVPEDTLNFLGYRGCISVHGDEEISNSAVEEDASVNEGNNNNNSNNNISNAVDNNNSNNIRNNVNSGASSAVNKDANVRVYLYRFYESRLKEERELRKMMTESLIEKLKEVEMLCPVWPRNCIFFSSYSR